MTKANVPIKNIFYMLSYAFDTLTESEKQYIEKEDFQGAEDLFAAVLAHGVAAQVKRGLYKEYIEQTEEMETVRGRINLPQTIRLKTQRKQRIVCEHDTLSVNNVYNRILKETMRRLLVHPDVQKSRKAELKKLIMYFSEVEGIPLKAVRWSALRFQKNNQHYKLLLNVCHFVWQGWLLTETEGAFKAMQFRENAIARLYERFVRAYYKKTYKNLTVGAPYVEWDVEGVGLDSLPVMHTDITLEGQDAILIIDTKFYSEMMARNQFGKETYHSANLYQLFTYVKNMQANTTKKVSGMLLYAQTETGVLREGEFLMGGNAMYIAALDLNREFDEIKARLDGFIARIFP